MIYTDYTVRVQNNGYFSDPINKKQGLHQGGPCSSLYFLVIAEVLAILIKQNKEIKGIEINEILNLLNQFADDLDIFSTADENSIKQIFNTLDFFYLQTGLKINYDKTTVYRVGSLRKSNARLYTQNDRIKWSNCDISVLGVQICHEDIVEKNFLPLIESTKSRLNSWVNRGLSLIGKVNSCKYLGNEFICI